MLMAPASPPPMRPPSGCAARRRTSSKRRSPAQDRAPSTKGAANRLAIHAEAEANTSRKAPTSWPMNRRSWSTEPAEHARVQSPALPGRGGQRIVVSVSEADWRRHGDDARMLRQCGQVSTEADPKKELAMSYKSVFKLRCQNGEAPKNPWQELENPEIERHPQEADLILNQVWLEALQRRKLALPRLPTMDGTPPRGGISSMNLSTRANSEETLGRRRSSRSVSRTRPPSRGDPRGDPAELGSMSRTPSKGRPGSPMLPAVDRIRPIDDSELADMEHPASNHPERFCRSIDMSKLRARAKPLCMWITVDADTGNVQAFRKCAANRLETAHKEGRGSVPLAGLDDPSVEDSIVVFSTEEGAVEKRQGGTRGVRRVEIGLSSSEAVVHVHLPEEGAPGWRFADTEIPGHTEERRVQVSYQNVVHPTTPKPPVPKDRKQTFLNLHACGAE